MPRMRALSLSVLLAENTPDNGPLMLMPGSHRIFLTCLGATPDDHYRTSLKKQEYGVPDRQSLTELAHRHGIVAPTGKAGTVVIFNSHTWHGGTLNRTDRPRRGLHSYFTRRGFQQQLDQKAYIRPETYERLSPAARFILDV